VNVTTIPGEAFADSGSIVRNPGGQIIHPSHSASAKYFFKLFNHQRQYPLTKKTTKRITH
jgi:hypothetical protein